jgi:hypothetical protein
MMPNGKSPHMKRSPAQAGVQFRPWNWTPACAGERSAIDSRHCLLI